MWYKSPYDQKESSDIINNLPVHRLENKKVLIQETKTVLTKKVLKNQLLKFTYRHMQCENKIKDNNTTQLWTSKVHMHQFRFQFFLPTKNLNTVIKINKINHNYE